MQPAQILTFLAQEAGEDAEKVKAEEEEDEESFHFPKLHPSSMPK